MRTLNLSKVVPKIPAACIDTGAVKVEGNRDKIKKEEKSRTVGPPPALVAETGVDGNTCQDSSDKPSS